ncbi:MAG: RNA 2',3'-cyclic phosphodiesterase [Bacillaceae bacterium]|nr:RNA 2',3'-cyclic phosphodiesterase [Bacillaceae bacterium]
MTDGKEKRRLFVALSLPDHCREKLHRLSSQWKKDLYFRKWVHPDDYHVTLTFIGDCHPEDTRRIEQILGEVISRHRRFPLETGKPGTFGQRKRPAILWMGIRGDLQRLTRLQNDIASNLEQAGLVRRETRPYRPHITLAREFKGRLFPADDIYIPDNETETACHWTVDGITLYQSHFGQTPMYEAVKTFPIE